MKTTHRRITLVQRFRRATTLIELLAVILIMGMITAATIPAVAPHVSGRRIREGARMVSTFINAARNRAIETGRPAGIWIERLPGLAEAAETLYMCEVPPSYAGDFLDSTVECVVVGSDGLPAAPSVRNLQDYWNIVIPRSRTTFLMDSWANPDPMEQQVVREGDLIQIEGYDRKYPLKIVDMNIGGKGQKWWYILRGRNCPSGVGPNGPYDNAKHSNGTYVIRWFDRTIHTSHYGVIRTSSTPFNYDSHGVRYQIHRQPIRMQAGSIRLPETVVIDLNFSSMTSGSRTDAGVPFHPRSDPGQAFKKSGSTITGLKNPYWGHPHYPADNTPVIVVFSPSGSVDRVYCQRRDKVGNFQWEGVEPHGPIYLLIGDREHLSTETFLLAQSAAKNLEVQFQKNWTNLNALWVRITPNTGNITVSLVDDLGTIANDKFDEDYLESVTGAGVIAADPTNVHLTRRRAVTGLLVGGR